MVSNANLQNNANVAVGPDAGVVQAPAGRANFIVSVRSDSVLNYAQSGNDLVIKLKDGRVLKIKDFFANGADFNNLVFSSEGVHQVADFSQALGKAKDGINDSLVTYQDLETVDGSGAGIGLAGILTSLAAGVAGIGGIVAVASGNGGDNDPQTPSPRTLPSPSFQILDNVGSLQGQIKSGMFTDDTTPTFQGTASPGSVITISIDGVEVKIQADSSTGAWSYTPDKPLSEGAHHITVKETDGRGNESSLSNTDFTVDTTPPALPGMKLISRGNEVADDAATNDTTPTATGRAEPGSTITLVIDGKEVTVKADSKTGDWSYTPDTPLSEGYHDIRIYETDQAGNKSAEKEFGFTVDTIVPKAPVFTITDDVDLVKGVVADGGTTNDNKPTFSGQGEPLSTIKITIDGVSVTVEADAKGNWSYTPSTALADKSYTVTVVETDRAGNVSPESKESFTIDTSVPLDGAAPTITEVWDDVGPVKDVKVESGKTTDDTQPTIRGEGAEANGWVNIYDNGKQIGMVQADGNGKWEFTPANPLEGADHTFTAKNTDLAGNEGSESNQYIIRIDTGGASTIPTITTVTDAVGSLTGPVADKGVTNDKQPTVSGTGGPINGSVEIFVDGVSIGTVQADGKGDWSFKLTTDLSDGTHVFTAKNLSDAGIPGGASGSHTVTVDTVAPVVSNVDKIYDDAGSDHGYVAQGKATDDLTPTLQGKDAEPGSTIKIYNGSALIGETIVGADGKWEFTPASGLPQGNYEFRTKSVDAAGNESEFSASFSVTLLSKPGTVPAIDRVEDNVDPLSMDIGNGGYTNDNLPKIYGSGGPANGKVNVYVDGDLKGQATTDVNGNWSYQLTNLLPDGEHTFTAKNVNVSGEGDASTGWKVIVDTAVPDSAPSISEINDDVNPKTGPVGRDGYTNDVLPDLSGTGGLPGCKVVVYDNGKKIGEATVDGNGNWTYHVDQSLTSGDHVFTVKNVDQAGNESNSSDAYKIIVDTVAPDVPRITVVWDDVGPQTGEIANGNLTNDNMPKISGSGAEPGSIVKIYDGGTTVIGETTADANGNWEYQITSYLSDGEHKLTVTSTDKAGNESAQSQTWVINVGQIDAEPFAIKSVYDNVDPDQGNVAAGGYTNDTTPTISGSGALPNTVVKIYNGAVLLGEVTADATGKWEFTPGTGLADGTYNFVAKNGASETPAWTVHIDTVPPIGSSPVITEIMDDYGNVTGKLAPNASTDDTTPTLKGTGAEANGWVRIYGGDDGKLLIGKVQADASGNWTFTPDTPLSGGNHVFTARKIDLAGNEGEVSNSYPIRIDAGDVPNIPLLTAVYDNTGAAEIEIGDKGMTKDATPKIVGGGALANGTVEIFVDGVSVGTTKANDKGEWSFEVSSLSDGSHIFTAKNWNAQGTPSAMSDGRSVVVDTIAPVVPKIGEVYDNAGDKTGPLTSGETTDDLTPTLRGSGAEPDSTIRIYNGNTLIGETTVGADGKWEFTPDAGLAEGSYSFTAKSVDKAGNESTLSDSFNVTLLSKPGTVPAIDRVEDNVDPLSMDIGNGGYTNDNLPKIYGSSGPANGKVNVYVDGILMGQATADANGKWSYQLTNMLPDGEHTFTAKNVNASGEGDASTSWKVIVDTVAPSSAPTIGDIMDDYAPQTGSIGKDGYSNDALPDLSGTGGLPGCKVAVYDNGVKIGEATVDGSGNWTYHVDKTLTSGDHVFTVKNVDQAGNESSPSAEYKIIVDVTAPNAPQIGEVYDSEAPVMGPIVNGGLTNDHTPKLSGAGAEPNSVVKIYDNGNLFVTIAADANGKWEYQVTTDLSDGEHKFTVTSTDKAGNESDPSSSWTINVGSIDPDALEIKSVNDNVDPVQGPVVNGGYTNDTTPTISGVGALPNSVVRIYDGMTLLGETTADAAGKWEFTPNAGLPDGTYSFIAKNGASETPAWTIHVDTVAPVGVKPVITEVYDDAGNVTGKLDPNATTDDTTPTLRGTGEPNGLLNVYGGDGGKTLLATIQIGGDGKWEFTPASALPGGNHVFVVKNVDLAGNEGAVSDGFAIRIDAGDVPNIPLITGVYDNNGGADVEIGDKGMTKDATPKIVGGGALANGTVEIFVDGVSVGTTKANDKGEWSFEVSSLSDGSHIFTAKNWNAQGTPSAMSDGRSVVVDTVAPVVPKIGEVYDDAGDHKGVLTSGETTDDATPTLRGSGAEPNSIVKIYNGNTLIGETTVGADGKWEFTPKAGLTEGSYSFTAKSVDAAGNESALSDAFNVKILFAPNDTPTINKVEDDVNPVTDPVANGGYTNDNLPKIYGSGGPANGLVNLYVDGVKVGQATSDANGNWSYQLTDMLPDGEHTFTAKNVNVSGEGPGSTGWKVIVDTAAPISAPMIGDIMDDYAPQTGSIGKDGYTNDALPDLSGTGGLPGCKVAVYDNGVKIGEATVDGSGNWTYHVDKTLTSGDHVFTVKNIDQAGNESSPSAEYKIIVDVTAPNAPQIGEVYDSEAPVMGPIVNGGLTNDHTPKLSGAGAEPNSIVKIYDNGVEIAKVTADANGKWEYQVPDNKPLSDGEHKLTVTNTDKAGNESDPSSSWTIKVGAVDPDDFKIMSVNDNVDPQTGDVANGGYTNDTTPTVSGVGALPNSIVRIYDGATLLGETTADISGKWEFTPPVGLADGTYNFIVKNVSGGSEIASSGPWTVMIDTVAPNGPAPVITEVYDDYGTVGKVDPNTATDDTTPTIRGTAEANGWVNVYDNGTLLGRVQVGSDGKWEFTPGSPLGGGDHTFFAENVDLAGNKGASSNSYHIRIDNQPPTTSPSITSVLDNVDPDTGTVLDNGSTNDTRPTIVGNGGPVNGFIQIYVDGVAVGTTQADANGNWSFELINPLSDGKHVFTAANLNVLGGQPGPVLGNYSVIIDTTAPVSVPEITEVFDNVDPQTGSVGNGKSTNDTKPQISGIGAEPGGEVNVYVDGNFVARVTADASGKWTYELQNALTEGPHSFSARAVDKAGNAGAESNKWMVIVDTAPPEGKPTITEVQDDLMPNIGKVNPGGETNDDTPTIKGTTDVNGRVNVYIDGKLAGIAIADSSGNWSFEVKTGLSQGSHVFMARKIDDAGNEASASSDEYSITVSLAPPPGAPLILGMENNNETPVLNVANGGYTNDTTPKLHGDSAGAFGKVNIYAGSTLLGSAIADANGNWTYESPALTNGDYVFTAKKVDGAGLEGPVSNSWTVHIDTVPPPGIPSITSVYDDHAPITDNVAQGGHTNDTTPRVNGSGGIAGELVAVYVDGTYLGTTLVDVNGTWSYQLTSPLADGPHTFTARNADAAGNKGGESGGWTVIVDTVAPDTVPTVDRVVDDVAPQTGEVLNGDYTNDLLPRIEGKGGMTGGTVNVYVDGVFAGAATVDGSGNWAYDVNKTLTSGEHTITARNVDKAGNEGADSAGYKIIVDVTAPAAPKVDMLTDDVGLVQGPVADGGVTDDRQPKLNGSDAEVGSVVKIYDNGTLIATVSVDSVGKWEYQITSDLANGEHKFTVTSTDKAGNESYHSTPYTITVGDAVLPQAPKIVGLYDDTDPVQGDVINGGYTNDLLPTIRGEGALAGGMVRVYADGVLLGTTTADQSGNWTYQVAKNLAAGGHVFTATNYDSAAGESDPSANWNVTVMPAPLLGFEGVTITAQPTLDTAHGLPVDGSGFATTTTATDNDNITRANVNLSIAGTLSKALVAGTQLEISVDGGATWQVVMANSGKNWSYVIPSALPEGENSFQFRISDLAGNIAVSTDLAPQKVYIDLTSPDAIAAPVISGKIEADKLFNLSGTAEKGAYVALIDDVNNNGMYEEGIDTIVKWVKADSGTGNWSMNASLGKGVHNLGYVVFDAAGNQSALSDIAHVGVPDGSRNGELSNTGWGTTYTAGNRYLQDATVGMDAKGNWMFFQNDKGGQYVGNLLTTTDAVNYSTTILARPDARSLEGDTNKNFYTSASFADINRDGYADIISQTMGWSDDDRSFWTYNPVTGVYDAKTYSIGSWAHIGGVVVYDRDGDGYLDFALGSANDNVTPTLFRNNKGEFVLDNTNGLPGGGRYGFLQSMSGVDINNDGAVDLVGNSGNGYGDLRQLTILQNNNGKSFTPNSSPINNIFTNEGDGDYDSLGIRLTWADFDGDGYLDMFLSRGDTVSNATVGNSNESRIYWNNKGAITNNNVTGLGDNHDGSVSLAVDWNHDGKMDVIEAPTNGRASSEVLLWTNQGAKTFDKSNLVDVLWNVTGAAVLDYNWDGARDLILNTSTGTKVITNTNAVADGTSLHLKIVDSKGINVFYGNTVQLYDSKGHLVATTIINPQSEGSNDSSAIVDFYGLDPNETYSVEMLRILSGTTSHVSDGIRTDGMTGYNTVNVSWGGLKPGESHDAFVLTTDGNNLKDDNSSTQVGTGYNDHFFGSGGNDTYEGGGGWNHSLNGSPETWSSTGGMDIVDYRHATGAINGDLNLGFVAGWGEDILRNIEGLVGGQYDDVFTDNAKDNMFEGRGGNDIFNLHNGGHDQLVYNLIDKLDATGGNGSDQVNGFHIGSVRTDANADVIDLSGLFEGASIKSGTYKDSQGLNHLDGAANVTDYLQVIKEGNNTVVKVDLDGAANGSSFTTLVTLNNVSTTLEDMLANHQLVV